MKQKLQIFVCIVMVIFMLPIIAFADPGDGNVDGGGGGMGDGTGANLWNPGYDGVRVTIIRDSNNIVEVINLNFVQAYQAKLETVQ